jgi:hypothetical protein
MEAEDEALAAERAAMVAAVDPQRESDDEFFDEDEDGEEEEEDDERAPPPPATAPEAAATGLPAVTPPPRPPSPLLPLDERDMDIRDKRWSRELLLEAAARTRGGADPRADLLSPSDAQMVRLSLSLLPFRNMPIAAAAAALVSVAAL